MLPPSPTRKPPPKLGGDDASQPESQGSGTAVSAR